MRFRSLCLFLAATVCSVQPCSFEVVVRSVARPVLSAVIAAPGTTARVASVMRPVISAVVCAR
ncbi:MAG: hypothetical protein HY235_21110 [Acidobacteria bacterium]|nr:hypothetical protein [Acidobacteriota bacterium]